MTPKQRKNNGYSLVYGIPGQNPDVSSSLTLHVLSCLIINYNSKRKKAFTNTVYIKEKYVFNEAPKVEITAKQEDRSNLPSQPPF